MSAHCDTQPQRAQRLCLGQGTLGQGLQGVLALRSSHRPPPSPAEQHNHTHSLEYGFKLLICQVENTPDQLHIL